MRQRIHCFVKLHFSHNLLIYSTNPQPRKSLASAITTTEAEHIYSACNRLRVAMSSQKLNRVSARDTMVSQGMKKLLCLISCEISMDSDAIPPPPPTFPLLSVTEKSGD